MATVYLLPTVLSEGITNCLPAYILDAVKHCTSFYVENERSARRYLKLLSKDIVIDDHEWHTIKEIQPATITAFKRDIESNKTIGVISEAGCPGVADPGQELVAVAQSMGAVVKPLVGPNSILLALMASGMNGQQFRFLGYLPIDSGERSKAIKKIESESRQQNCTQVFIETPYRNHQLLEALVKGCEPATKICIAVDLTAPTEMIRTMAAKEWKNVTPDIHKKPAIFLLHAGE